VGLFDDIRSAARAVTERARFVRIDEAGLAAQVDRLAAEGPSSDSIDPTHHRLGSVEETLAYVLVVDAVNFGSGWFPHLVKRPGCSGYFTIALALRDYFEHFGPLDPEQLAMLEPADCTRLFGQEPIAPGSPVSELMEHFAEALASLGDHVLANYEGSFEALVTAANGSAEKLVELLAEMPYYRDVCCYEEIDVPFYKRAQITASDLASAFDGQGLGTFHDLANSTMFADNLVPHVLRRDGVLLYDEGLLARIEAEELIPARSPEEVEIRAVALHAVERMVAMLRERGVETTAAQLDQRLWTRGQLPEIKAHPRHRTRTIFY